MVQIWARIRNEFEDLLSVKEKWLDYLIPKNKVFLILTCKACKSRQNTLLEQTVEIWGCTFVATYKKRMTLLPPSPAPFPLQPRTDLKGPYIFLALLQYPVVSCHAQEVEPVDPDLQEAQGSQTALSPPLWTAVLWLLTARHPPAGVGAWSSLPSLPRRAGELWWNAGFFPTFSTSCSQ